MRLSVNDYYVNVVCEGGGSPFVVLHGFTGAASNWASFFPSWSKHFQVIAPDIIGHGESEAPIDPGRYTMDRAADDLVGLLDQLGIAKTHMLGYSMGGRLALTFAVRHPDRVRSLILESSSPGLKTEQERSERMERDEALADRIEQIGVETFVEEWEKVPLFATQSAEVREMLRKQRAKNREIGLANSLRGMGTGAQKTLWKELSSLEVPVKLIVGELDVKFRQIAREMQESFPNAEIDTVPETGHAIHAENPRFFDKIVEEWIIKNERTE
ncbi:MAG TPA: 2-succinyl-6-hydroxy-2,4-cyclohexadiene-1-carboxylate synthase [Bacillales bacterium]|nr:2-succinyl-6-hydroxy-2,4-cyclohexadiene-1-carboxylate synthase [Bacillales bacterium]